MELIPLLDVFVCCNAFLRPLIQCPKGTTFFNELCINRKKYSSESNFPLDSQKDYNLKEFKFRKTDPTCGRIGVMVFF